MLHVTSKRHDGYHLLQSLVCFAELGDDVFLTPAEDVSLTVRGEFAENLYGDNLITKVAHALAQSANIRPHGHITLTKNLPIGAGLGGGSSDAAAALKLLEEYWNCKIPPNIATSLGSDIPACLHGMPLWMEGAGEQITPLQLPFDVPVLLVNPRVQVATQSVYQKVEPPYHPAMHLPAAFSSQAALIAFLHSTHNALEAPAIALAPVISDVLAAMAALPACQLARMSGSGATCFGLFPSQIACESAHNALKAAHPDWWIRSTILRGTHG